MKLHHFRTIKCYIKQHHVIVAVWIALDVENPISVKHGGKSRQAYKTYAKISSFLLKYSEILIVFIIT